MSVTPIAGLASVVATGGTAVVVVGPLPNGGIIVNPYSPTDEGLANSEPIYVDPTGAPATLVGNGTTFAIQPGGSWQIIPGQTSSTSVNAASSGHTFSVISW